MAAKVTFLVDTCVFIDFLRGEKGVYDFLANDEDVRTAQTLIQTYTKSHNLQIADAFIAATALYMNVTLITYNKSDFRYISDLTLF
jgi:predicted nucleic acid-binding protein